MSREQAPEKILIFPTVNTGFPNRTTRITDRTAIEFHLPGQTARKSWLHPLRRTDGFRSSPVPEWSNHSLCGTARPPAGKPFANARPNYLADNAMMPTALLQNPMHDIHNSMDGTDRQVPIVDDMLSSRKRNARIAIKTLDRWRPWRYYSIPNRHPDHHRWAFRNCFAFVTTLPQARWSKELGKS